MVRISPEKRGIPFVVAGNSNCRQSIPAWAGNTRRLRLQRLASSDHPRVGGEHVRGRLRWSVGIGSSPRGRGTRSGWIISPWAGNTRRLRLQRLASSDHPRWRGTRPGPVEVVRRDRIIPAWAGNTFRVDHLAALDTDHPRVGGEHEAVERARIEAAGSSPRGRGTPDQDGLEHSMLRIIPAWAGNTPCPDASVRLKPDHPRVGGEHDNQPLIFFHSCGSSPRGRGTRTHFDQDALEERIIPAWAGNTAGGHRKRTPSPDHPRVGGEHETSTSDWAAMIGSSPRGRGTPT